MRMYDRTGLSTKCTLIKNGFKNARTGTKAKFRPFVDALVPCERAHKTVSETAVKSDPAFCLEPTIKKTNSASTRLVRCFLNYRDTRTPSGVGR